MSKVFNIKDYNSSYVMHCPEKWMAAAFCNYLYEHGKRWFNGDSYLYPDGSPHTEWDKYGDKTYYRFNAFKDGGTYGGIYMVSQEGYHILLYSDFDWEGTSVEPWSKDAGMDDFLSTLLDKQS